MANLEQKILLQEVNGRNTGIKIKILSESKIKERTISSNLFGPLDITGFFRQYQCKNCMGFDIVEKYKIVKYKRIPKSYDKNLNPPIKIRKISVTIGYYCKSCGISHSDLYTIAKEWDAPLGWA